MKNVVSACLFLLLGVTVHSQSLTLSGQILDTEENPLIGTNVILADADDVTKFQGATDIDGNYVINDIVPGNYKLKISYVGFFSVFKDIEFVDENIEYETIVMYEAPVGLNEVVIEGKVPLAQQKAIRQVIMHPNIRFLQMRPQKTLSLSCLAYHGKWRYPGRR